MKPIELTVLYLFELTDNGIPWYGFRDIVNGNKGEWIFNTHITGDSWYSYPNVMLYGADVKLPE